MLKVIIDGENFRHQIAYALVDAGHLEQDAANDFFKFRLHDFFADVLNRDDIQIVYCTTKVLFPKHLIADELLAKLNRINLANRRWISYLTNHGVNVVKTGTLRIHESAPCEHCGKRTMGLQEKGVDVRVATELLLAAEQHQSVALACSDSDLLPAVQAARTLDDDVIYVCRAERINPMITQLASSTITFADEQVLQYFEK